MTKKRFPALLLSLAIFTALAAPARAVDYPEKDHPAVDYADMVYTGFDDDTLQRIFHELLELKAAGDLEADTPQIRERVEALYRLLVQEYDWMETQYALIDLRRDADLTNEWAAAESADFSDRFNHVADQCWSALALLADSPYADILEADGGKSKVRALLHYEPMTEEEAELFRREEELIQQYESVMAGEFTVTDDQGRERSASELHYDLTGEASYRLLTQIQKAKNEAAGAIFMELLALRSRLAELYGYDSYAEYAYTEVYNRDYSMEDIQKVYAQVKETLVPLCTEILELAGNDIYALDALPVSTGEEILDRIEPYMDRIHPELGETFRFMRQHHLYDIEAEENKNALGYTVALPAYGSAFIFDSPYESYQDWSTVIHEFGHFNETFHSAESGLWSDFSIDVGEIHSQGLEVLLIEYADELFGRKGRGFAWSTLLSMVDSVLDGCLFDEFQAQIYSHPDMTLEEINALFGQLALEYGYPDQGDQTAYLWVEVPHTFQQPMYYISYATSALSAIDLYLLSLEDRDRAVETYMELSALGMTLPYRAAVKQVGLRNIFSSGVVEELAETLSRELHGEAQSTSGGVSVSKRAVAKPGSKSLPFGTATILLVVSLGALVLSLALVAVVLRRRGRRKQEDLTTAGKWHRGKEDPWD